MTGGGSNRFKAVDSSPPGSRKAVLRATLLPHLTPAERASPLYPLQGGQASHVYSAQFGACFLTTRYSTKPMASADCWEEVGRYPGFPAAPDGRSLGSTDRVQPQLGTGTWDLAPGFVLRQAQHCTFPVRSGGQSREMRRKSMCALRTSEATPPHTQILLKAKCGSGISDICTTPQGHTQSQFLYYWDS